MTVSPNLEVINVNESQSNKATTVNQALLGIEQAVSDQLSMPTSGGGDIVLPYNNATDLSNRAALRFVRLVLQAGASAAFNVIHPAKRHMFIVTNETSQAATVKTPSGTGVAVPAGADMLLYCDGVSVVPVSSAAAAAVSSFLALIDTPGSFEGQGGKYVAVKADATGVEFVAAPSGGETGGGTGETSEHKGPWVVAGTSQIDFEDGTVPLEFTFDAGGGAYVVDRADAGGGTTKALRFRDIADNETAYLEYTTMDLPSGGAFGFRYEVSSEENYDQMIVTVDGVEVLSESGATGWKQFSHALSAGTHTIRISYTKDSSAEGGDDTVYISAFSYPDGSASDYVHGDTVSHNDRSWFCLVTGTSQEPGTGSDWMALGDPPAAEPVETGWRGARRHFTNFGPVTASGTTAAFTIVPNDAAAIDTGSYSDGLQGFKIPGGTRVRFRMFVAQVSGADIKSQWRLTNEGYGAVLAAAGGFEAVLLPFSQGWAGGGVYAESSVIVTTSYRYYLTGAASAVGAGSPKFSGWFEVEILD